MAKLSDTRNSLPEADAQAADQAGRILDGKTKPRGSLGMLELVARRVAAITGQARPPLPKKAIVVFGADHGVARQGVSAYPQEVTGQMLMNFALGGAAINVLSRQVGAEVVVCDVGTVAPPPPSDGIRSDRFGPGTEDFTAGPAMSREQVEAALEYGIALAHELSDAGIGLVGLGEMGIGNTTSASALTAKWLNADVDLVTGRGTGIDEERRQHKASVIRTALELHADRTDPVDVLAALGGFEIAGLAGVALGCAERRIPVLLDGFISSVAGLAAARIEPRATYALLASHRSVEPGHRLQLDALGLAPLLDLDLRLGEGTGAALAMPLVEASLRVMHEMASFDDAGVTDTGK